MKSKGLWTSKSSLGERSGGRGVGSWVGVIDLSGKANRSRWAHCRGSFFNEK